MLKFVNPWVLLASVILLGLATAGGYQLGSDHEVAKQVKTEALIAKAADAFDVKVGEHVSKIRPIHKTIQNNIEGLTRESTVYRDCVNEPAMQRLLDDARANRGSAERETGVSP